MCFDFISNLSSAKKTRFFFFVGAVSFLCLIPFSASADYTDYITVKPEELRQAALDVLKPHGLRKTKEDYLETKWIYDQVARSRGLLKKVASKIYERRSRYKIWIKQRDYDTEIKISGIFQERPLEANPSLSWRLIKPSLADLDTERQTFMKILMRLEALQQKSEGRS